MKTPDTSAYELNRQLTAWQSTRPGFPQKKSGKNDYPHQRLLQHGQHRPCHRQIQTAKPDWSAQFPNRNRTSLMSGLRRVAATGLHSADPFQQFAMNASEA